MTSKRGIDCESGCFPVANFSHHDDIWVLTQEGAQPVGKSEPDFRFYLGLIDSGHLIFNRILYGGNINFWFIQNFNHGVESSRFSGASRARSQHHSGLELE